MSGTITERESLGKIQFFQGELNLMNLNIEVLKLRLGNFRWVEFMNIAVTLEPLVRSTGAIPLVFGSQCFGSESHPLELGVCACQNGRVSLFEEANHHDPISRDSADAQPGDQSKEYRRHTALLQQHRFESP